jgi:cytoskeletal protein CcmA (bactofilin family)
MVWSWLNQKRGESSEWTGFLDQGVKIEGRLEAPGTFRIDSLVKGTLISEETLIIGEHGFVEGFITGKHVLISGRVDAIIHAKGKVELEANAIVTGEVHSACLVIEPGAAFNGQFYLKRDSNESEAPILIPVRATSDSILKAEETTVP